MEKRKVISNLIYNRPLNKDFIPIIQGMSKSKVEKYFNELVLTLSQEKESKFLSLHERIYDFLYNDMFINKKELNHIFSHHKDWIISLEFFM